MTYTLNDLIPAATAHKAFGEALRDQEPALSTKVMAAITPEEIAGIQTGLQAYLFDVMFKGDTAENITNYLRLTENVLGFIERVTTLDKVAHVVPTKDLTAKDVEIMRGLGLTKSATLFELALAANAPAPRKPKATRKRAPKKPKND